MAVDDGLLLIGPHGRQSAIYRLVEGELCRLALLSYPALWSCVMAQNGWFACIVRKGKRVSVGRFREGLGVDYSGVIEFPIGAHARCLAIKDRTLYVGGDGQEHTIGMIRLDAEPMSLEPLEIPKEVGLGWKAIDDLLLDGDRLVAVDNLVIPKWLWEYDVGTPVSPDLLRVAELQSHGTYEHVTASAIGKTRIAVGSHTMGMAGPGKHIAIYSRVSLNQIFVLDWVQSPHDSSSITSQDDTAPVSLHSMAFVGDRLFLPAGRRGIACLNEAGLLSFDDRFVSLHEKVVHISRSPEGSGIIACIEDAKGLVLPRYVEL